MLCEYKGPGESYQVRERKIVTVNKGGGSVVFIKSGRKQRIQISNGVKPEMCLSPMERN